MKTLVIDTATRACSVALFDGDVVLASHHEIIGRGHAERLLPFIAALPGRGRAEQVVVNVGPGSFTGIRVGVAAARALGLAWGVPVSGYNCLSLIAAMARAQSGLLAGVDVAMAGGHGEYFFQNFDSAGSPTSGVVSLTPAMVVKKARATLMAGDFSVNLTALLGHRHLQDILPDASFWRLIKNIAPLPASPIYGRAPDAALPKVSAP